MQVSGKLTFLDQYVTKCKAEGTKVLVFSQFTMLLDVIDDMLRWRGHAYERLDGNVQPPPARL